MLIAKAMSIQGWGASEFGKSIPPTPDPPHHSRNARGGEGENYPFAALSTRSSSLPIASLPASTSPFSSISSAPSQSDT